ncbi:hypothetical protein L1987_65671 [Smallanthus sonchifolius]|uniref:Uncharacterized protein n=1 Tax=Smallanthus sonchifolius TaxID=185202 RepID=A0ACB9BV88_9ASTR|nr:hypothetical protein L1987_65671 [Smallanthus sonchifolius]
MALPFYRLVFPQSSYEVCKPKRNIQQTVEAKNEQQRLISCGAMTKINFINLADKVRELEKKVSPLNVDFEIGSFSTLELLEHIDDIERLGLGYVYQFDIRKAPDIITSIYELNVGLEEKEDSLHETSLRFRILRQ